jgi:hypothetical protein
VSVQHEPVPVKLIFSMITSDNVFFKKIIKSAEHLWGKIDFLSEKLSFHHTDYYYEEMGDNLFRKICSFEKLISPEQLSSVKIQCSGFETDLLDDKGRRRVNVDPGYLAREKVVLSTFKNFSHRIYLKEGVYGDLTLLYRDKEFRPLDWTFPDYQSQEMLQVLRVIRDRYTMHLKFQSRKTSGIEVVKEGVA